MNSVNIYTRHHELLMVVTDCVDRRKRNKLKRWECLSLSPLSFILYFEAAH